MFSEKAIINKRGLTDKLEQIETMSSDNLRDLFCVLLPLSPAD